RPSAAIPAAVLIAMPFVFIVLTVTANRLGACVSERSLIWAVGGVSNPQVLTCEFLFIEVGFWDRLEPSVASEQGGEQHGRRQPSHSSADRTSRPHHPSARPG